MVDYESVSLVCRFFNLSMTYVDVDMTWEEWIVCLMAALRGDEMARYEKYLLAGGKAKDWKWYYHFEHSTMKDVTPQTMDKLAASLAGKARRSTVRGSFHEFAQYRNLRRVKDRGDGVYVDAQTGEIVDTTGFTLVPVGS